MNLQLNKWLGSDKPKKDDFNSDNQKVDDAYQSLTQSIDQLQTAQQDYATAQDLNSLSGTVTTLSGTVSSHSSNAGIHVTQAEKNSWSSGAGFVVTSYTGDGYTSKKITLGYKPKFGLIFIVGDSVGRAVWSSNQFISHCGMMSDIGCSLGVTLNSDGFTVEHSIMGGVDGLALKLNTLDAKYICFLWK